MRTSDLPPMPETPNKRMPGRKKSPESFYSGRELEYDLFGTMDTSNLGYQKALGQVADSRGYVKRKEAMELVKKFQSQDPTNPRKDFLRELRNALLEIFSLVDEKEMDRVKAYTALGSPHLTSLDFWHGTDAFITYDEDGKEYAVTLDASQRKKDAPKADIVVGEMPDAAEETEKFLEEVDKIADIVARNIEKQKKNFKK